MGNSTKLLLIEDNRIEARQTQHWLAAAKDPPFDVECVGLIEDGLERLAKGGVDIVLLDLNLPDSRGLETFEKIHERAPQTPIVVLTGEYDESIGPLAVERGAQDYLVKQQVDAMTLARVLRHGLARHRARQEEISRSRQRRPAVVIGFIGAKGGVGTTTTALNIALALSQQGKATILVELRPFFGTLSCHLHLKPQANLSSLLELPPERINAIELSKTLNHFHQLANLQILCGPQRATEAKEIGPGQAESIIKGLSELADYIVLDLPIDPTSATRAVASLCHHIAVVTEREPTSVMAAKVLVSQLETWGVIGERVKGIVVNRTVLPVMMSVDEVRSGMGCPIVGIVTCAAEACQQAIVEGIPLVLAGPSDVAALCLSAIAEKLAADKLVDIIL